MRIAGLLLCCCLWWSHVQSSFIDVLKTVSGKTIESILNRFGKNSNRIQDHNLGEDTGDKFIFTGDDVKTVEDLLQTIAILREQIKELKSNIYSNKNILTLSKKDKDNIRRTFESQIAAINSTFLIEIKNLNSSWEKKVDSEKRALLQDLKEQFEKEKLELLSSLKDQHEKNINIIKIELANLQGAFNQSQLTVQELRTKLQEQQSLFTIKTKEFEAKSKVSVQAISDLREKLKKVTSDRPAVPATTATRQGGQRRGGPGAGFFGSSGSSSSSTSSSSNSDGNSNTVHVPPQPSRSTASSSRNNRK